MRSGGHDPPHGGRGHGDTGFSGRFYDGGRGMRPIGRNDPGHTWRHFDRGARDPYDNDYNSSSSNSNYNGDYNNRDSNRFDRDGDNYNRYNDQGHSYRPHRQDESDWDAQKRMITGNAQCFAKVVFNGTLEPKTPKDHPAAAMTFYSGLQGITQHCGISLLDFKDLTSKTSDYFLPRDPDLHPDMIDIERREYAAVLGHKILGGIKNDNVKNTMTTQFGDHNDGFRLLQSIMRNHVILLRRPHTPAAYAVQTQRPTYDKASTIYVYC